MKFLATLLLLWLSIVWWFISYKYLNNIIDSNITNQYNNISIMIFLSWMFIFWILFWKLISSKNKEIEKNVEEKNFTITEDKNIFIPEIKDIEEKTYYNYENDSDITKESIDIILDEREENYKHKINLKNETLENNISEKEKNFIISNNEIKDEFKIETDKIIEKNKENFKIKNTEEIEDTIFLNVANNLKKKNKQDLKIIEWIWPKIETLLNQSWIYSYKDLANSELSKIKSILEKAGKRYIMLHNPVTWSKQANIAQKGKFEELEEYQGKLVKWVEK